jgi:hypothetical protein
MVEYVSEKNTNLAPLPFPQYVNIFLDQQYVDYAYRDGNGVCIGVDVGVPLHSPRFEVGDLIAIPPTSGAIIYCQIDLPTPSLAYQIIDEFKHPAFDSRFYCQKESFVW